MANVRAMGSPSPILGTKSIVSNGTYTAAADNLDGFSSVEVAVPTPAVGSKTISENGTYNSLTDDNIYGYREVEVLVPSPPLMDKMITQNGEYEASDDGVYGYRNVLVNVPTPRENQGYRIITSSTGGYDASVTVQKGYLSGSTWIELETAVTVLYTTVQSTPQVFGNLLQIGYGNGWYIQYLIRYYDGSSDQVVPTQFLTWSYQESIDVIVFETMV